MKETWTDIPGLEGKYQISNMGRYKRLSRYIQGRRLPEEILPLNQSQVRVSWVLTVTNEWKRRNNKKKNSAEGRERATVHSVLECETVATFLHFTSI